MFIVKTKKPLFVRVIAVGILSLGMAAAFLIGTALPVFAWGPSDRDTFTMEAPAELATSTTTTLPRVWDNAFVTADSTVSLRFVPGSAVIHSNCLYNRWHHCDCYVYFGLSAS